METNKESRILDWQTAGEMFILMIPVQILLNYFQYLDFKNNVLPLQQPPSTILIKAISQMTTWLITISLSHTRTHTHRILREYGMGPESEVWCLISDSTMHLTLRPWGKICDLNEHLFIHL